MTSVGNGQGLIHETIERLRRCASLIENMMNASEVLPLFNQSMKFVEALSNTTTRTDSLIRIEAYRDENQMPDIMRVITNDLSEPYSIYTYRYFIHNWPNLCLLAYDTETSSYVGVIVCKMDIEPQVRGYIAMLAVDASYRRKGIGTQLVQKAIQIMDDSGCVEVSLETEVTNEKALNLYSGLGFIREKRLFWYYLNGIDAFRLKLHLRPIKKCVPSQELN